MQVQFTITHKISNSRGWGRYRATVDGSKIIQSSTGNEWVSAPHAGDVSEGAIISVRLQTMERVGKRKVERIYDEYYTLVATEGEKATIGNWRGFEVVVDGAKLAHEVKENENVTL